MSLKSLLVGQVKSTNMISCSESQKKESNSFSPFSEWLVLQSTFHASDRYFWTSQALFVLLPVGVSKGFPTHGGHAKNKCLFEGIPFPGFGLRRQPCSMWPSGMRVTQENYWNSLGHFSARDPVWKERRKTGKRDAAPERLQQTTEMEWQHRKGGLGGKQTAVWLFLSRVVGGGG